MPNMLRKKQPASPNDASIPGPILQVDVVAKVLAPGGAEELIVNQLLAARRDLESYRVVVVRRWRDENAGRLERAGVDVHRVVTSQRVGWLWPLLLVRALRRRRADVVHCHSPSVAALTRLTCWLSSQRGRPMAHVYTEHNVWANRSRVKRLALRATGPLDRARLACSHAVRESLPRGLQSGTEVLIHGIARDQLDGLARSRDDARRELGLPVDETNPCVGLVAGFRPEKRHDVAVEVMDRVCARVPEAHFAFIGDGETRPAVERRVREVGRIEAVRFTGQIAEASAMLRAFDVLLLTSDHEGLPVVILEAFSLGVPVVATDVGGVGEMVINDENGRLAPRGDVEALAAAVVELLESPATRRRLAAGAAHTGAAIDACRSADVLSLRYRSLVGRHE